LIPERAAKWMVFPGGGCGQAGGKSLLAGRRVVGQDEGGKLDLKMKVLVAEDAATRRKIMHNYLQQRGLENTAPFDEDILPRSIFWLKK